VVLDVIDIGLSDEDGANAEADAHMSAIKMEEDLKIMLLFVMVLFEIYGRNETRLNGVNDLSLSSLKRAYSYSYALGMLIHLEPGPGTSS
jgi:hypothetical protein